MAEKDRSQQVGEPQGEELRRWIEKSLREYPPGIPFAGPSEMDEVIMRGRAGPPVAEGFAFLFVLVLTVVWAVWTRPVTQVARVLRGGVGTGVSPDYLQVFVSLGVLIGLLVLLLSIAFAFHARRELQRWWERKQLASLGSQVSLLAESLRRMKTSPSAEEGTGASGTAYLYTERGSHDLGQSEQPQEQIQIKIE